MSTLGGCQGAQNQKMTEIIQVTSKNIQSLDLTPVKTVVEPALNSSSLAKLEMELEIKYEREPDDPRELSEIPEIRLWFLRLDAVYPWLPYVLDWKSGQLAQYAAMLVPHQFNRTEGIIYNPEALEIFVMGKIFTIADWLKAHNISGRTRLQAMAQTLGYEIDLSFIEQL